MAAVPRRASPCARQHLPLVNGTRLLGQCKIVQTSYHRVPQALRRSEVGREDAALPPAHLVDEAPLRLLEIHASLDEGENPCPIPCLTVLLMGRGETGALHYTVAGATHEEHHLCPSDAGQAGLLRRFGAGAEIPGTAHLVSGGGSRIRGCVSERLEGGDD